MLELYHGNVIKFYAIMVAIKLLKPTQPMINVRPKQFFITTLLLALLCVGIFLFLLYINKDPTVNYRPKYPTTNTSATSDQSESDIKKDTTSNLPQTSESVPLASTGNITIEDYSQSNGFVNINAVVHDFTPITCVFQLKSDGARPVVREVKDGCGGISIPQAEFEKIGDYALAVTAYDSTQKITSDIKTLTIK